MKNYKLLLFGLFFVLLSCSCFSANSLETSVELDPNNANHTYELMKHYEGRHVYSEQWLTLWRFLIISDTSELTKKEFETFHKRLFTNNSDIQLSSENLKRKSSINLSMELVFGYEVNKFNNEEIKDKTPIEKNIIFFNKYFDMLKRFYLEPGSYDLEENFAFRFYSPYFVELLDKNFVEPFVYKMYMNYTGMEEVQIWCKENQDKMQEFLQWSKNYNWNKDNK